MKIIFVVIVGLLSLNLNYPTIKRSSFIPAQPPIEGTRWNLIALSNTKIPAEKTSGTMYFILNKDSTVTGNGGCNIFRGKYSLRKDNVIFFGEIVRTNIACPDIDLERKYIDALAKADQYNLKGDTLSLDRGKFKSLAKFVAAH